MTCENNADSADRYLEVYRNIDGKIASLKEEIALLQEQVIGLQRIAVESRIQLFNEYMPHMLLCRNLDPTTQKALRKGLDTALSVLRGKLDEGALPEDAYVSWLVNIRSKLSIMFNTSQIDSLLQGFFSWQKMIGFHSDDR
jgi:hypothetical protein